MTTATATYRDEMLAEAEGSRKAADKAHRAGDATLRDAFLRKAIDRYTAAGRDGMARWAARFVGSPAR